MKGKCDYVEKLTEQLEYEYRVIDDFKKVFLLLYHTLIKDNRRTCWLIKKLKN